MYSKTKWNKQRYCWQLQNHVWITNFRGENWKTTMIGNFSYFFVVLRYGGSCQEMCGTILWADETGRLNNSTKYLLHASMTITSKRKNWNPWENCQKHALKLFWNALYWARIGRPDILWWVNKLARSIPEMDQSLWQNAWIDWYLTSITHVNTNFIVMWVTLQNNADWDCFKTPI